MRRALRTLTAILAALSITLLFIGPASADNHVRIHLIHGIPDTDVDVEAGGENVFEGFSFGDTQDLSALAGSTLEGLKVKAAGTDTVAIDAGDVALPASGNYTVIAHLDAEGNPTLGVFENDVSTIDAGQGRLTVRHTAAAPEVDILAGGSPVFSGVANGAGGTVDLDASTVSASVVPAGETEPVVIGPADLTIAEGQHLIVYAVGSLDADSLTVLTETIDDLHSNPDRIDTGNSLPQGGSGVTAWSLALIAGGTLLLAGTATVVTARRRVEA